MSCLKLARREWGNEHSRLVNTGQIQVYSGPKRFNQFGTQWQAGLTTRPRPSDCFNISSSSSIIDIVSIVIALRHQSPPTSRRQKHAKVMICRIKPIDGSEINSDQRHVLPPRCVDGKVVA